MGILTAIIDFHATVHVHLGNIHPLFPHHVPKCLLTHTSQIAGNDPVIIGRASSKIRQMLINGITGGRSHAGAHIHGILQSEIYNFTNRESINHCPVIFTLHATQDKGAASRHRP